MSQSPWALTLSIWKPQGPDSPGLRRQRAPTFSTIFATRFMPEFENLEPFIDRRQGDRITPVAPHHEQIQEYRPRRRGGQTQEAPRSRLRPKEVKIPAHELVTTQEMEKAFKIANRKEKKQQRRNQKNGLLGRLLKKLRTWWRARTRGKTAPAGQPGDRPERKRGKKPSARAEGRRDQRAGGTPPAGRPDHPKSRRRPRKQGAGGKGGPNEPRPPSKRSQPEGTAPPGDSASPPADANASGGGGKRRSRGGRNRRRRPSPGAGGSKPDASSTPKGS